MHDRHRDVGEDSAGERERYLRRVIRPGAWLSHGDHGRRVAPFKEERKVDAVRAQRCEAPRARALPARSPARRGGVGPCPPHVDGTRYAHELTHAREREAVGAVVAKMVADREVHVCAGGSGERPRGVGPGEGEGLLHEDVEPSVRSRLDLGGMQTIRCREDDGVADIGREQGIVAREGRDARRDGELGAQRFQARRVAGDHGGPGELALGIEGGHGSRVVLACVPDPHEGESRHGGSIGGWGGRAVELVRICGAVPRRSPARHSGARHRRGAGGATPSSRASVVRGQAASST